MDTESQDQLPASQRLGALSVRVLVKTVLKSALWLGIAWATTYFFPTAVWAWYVAFAFIAIGLLFSLSMLVAAIRAAAAEKQAAQGDSERRLTHRMGTSSHVRDFLVIALIAPLLGGAGNCNAAEPVNPAIPRGTYTAEREAEVLAKFNSMQGEQKRCGEAYIRAYQKSLFDYCVATDGGKNIGGGCGHVAYAWSLHTRVVELALERCTSASKEH